MRMKKWMGVLGMAAFMAVGIPGNAGSGLSMTAQAAGSGEMAGNVRVFDQADLFLEEEEKELQQAIDALREKMDMDAAVVTAEENPGSAQAYADDFYEAHGFGTGSGHDGALLLIDMDNRELCISTEAVSDGQPDRSGAGRHVRLCRSRRLLPGSRSVYGGSGGLLRQRDRRGPV